MPTSKKVERGLLYFPGPEGKVVPVTPADMKKFSYKELSEAVGGLIESIRPTVQGHTVWANEEGLLQGLEPNRHTWEVANKRVYLLNGYGESWRIVGRILVVYKTDNLTVVNDTIHSAVVKQEAIKADFVQRHDSCLVQEAAHV